MDKKSQELADIAGKLADLLSEDKDVRLLATTRLLQIRLRQPQAYITVCGETSTGKSSLINGLFGCRLLPVSAKPTTATVTQVVCRNDQQNEYFAIFRDATQAHIDQQQFNFLSVSPTADILRLQLRAKPMLDQYVGLQVFDTPGFNSVMAEHEEVLRSFLPESDVVVFVAGYRSGFGQVDQDLLEIIKTATASNAEIPIILLVNRCPSSVNKEDRRITEIVNNAKDCLLRDPDLIIIRSASEEVLQSAQNSECDVVPDSSALWNNIIERVFNHDYQMVVNQKLVQLLKCILEEAASSVERAEIELSVKGEDAAAIEAQIKTLERSRDKSIIAIERCCEKLRQQLPKIADRSADSMTKKMRSEIHESNKWLGYEECAQWVSAHALPYEVREAAKSIEEQISVELEMLDQELEEIANTAVKAVRSDSALKSEAVQKFTENLLKTFGQRIGGHVLTTITRTYGGVGGAAAGTGNLVKMAVSRVGRLFNQTFSRQVYTNIGRTFTKRMLQKLAVAVQIIIEVGLYFREVSTWQANLLAKTTEAIDSWRQEIKVDLKTEYVASIESNNVNFVRAIYDDLVNRESIRQMRAKNNLADELDKLRKQRSAIADLDNKVRLLEA